MDVLLLSTYELGHQPLALARPAAHLLAAGHDVSCQDLAVEPLDEAAVRAAQLVGISVPMHTATRLGVRLAERVRALNPAGHVCFYGLYASLHADVLLAGPADSVIGGEFEAPLVALAEQLAAGPGAAPTADGVRAPATANSAAGERVPATAISTAAGERAPTAANGTAGGESSPLVGVSTRAHDGGVFLGRQPFLLPRRDLLPPLDRYARVDTGTRQKVVGYVEASRGCAHQCLHCPITPVYGGRLRIVPAPVVLEDVRRLVALGAEHVTFGDPDFFNGLRHSLRLVETVHAEFPTLTYDVTIKVEHLLEHRVHLATLAGTGCLFVVSAVEAVQDHILEHLRKGHTARDVEEALALARAAGLVVRPTFVPFTPWTRLDDYVELLAFIDRHDLIRHVDPIQLAIRLLVPCGSSLVGTPAMTPHLGPFDEATFSYRWAHPDPRLDQLQEAVSAVVEQAAATAEDAVVTFARIQALAAAAQAGPTRAAARVAAEREPVRAGAVRRGAAAPAVLSETVLAAARARGALLPPVPRLTEAWFC
jgi:radical SAM superfamily enzyme YgiQ (UPF0313 family)